MKATPAQKLAGETKRFMAQGHDEATAQRLAAELLGLAAQEDVRVTTRPYRELYERELRRGNALLGRVQILNRHNQELKEQLAMATALLAEANAQRKMLLEMLPETT